MQKIVIAGNTLSAEIMYSYLEYDDRYEVVGFTVDRDFLKESKFHGLDVTPIEELDQKYSKGEVKIILGVGYSDLNRTRQKIFVQLKDLGFKIETYIHPLARIYNKNQIGEGSIILANSVIEPFSTVGENCVIWANCTIGHHSTIESHCWIASGSVVAGEATIKTNSFLGVNVTIANKVKVGEFNVIGGSTFISKDTNQNEVWLSRQGEKHRFDSENYGKFFLK